jgi:tmRNA-binding protein
VKVSDGHASIEGMDIPLYRKTSLKQIGNYDPKASRSLLLTKRELAILAQKTNKTGNTIKVIDIFI